LIVLLQLNIKKLKNKPNEIRAELGPFDMLRAMEKAERAVAGGKEDQIEELLKLRVQWHERLAFPLGCMALCFWALPLGIQPPRAGRARAIVVSVILSGFFYYLTIVAKFGALHNWAEPWAAMWLPNIIIVLTGFYMLRQKNQEEPILLLSWTEDKLYYLVDKLKEYIKQRRAA